MGHFAGAKTFLTPKPNFGLKKSSFYIDFPSQIDIHKYISCLFCRTNKLCRICWPVYITRRVFAWSLPPSIFSHLPIYLFWLWCRHTHHHHHYSGCPSRRMVNSGQSQTNEEGPANEIGKCLKKKIHKEKACHYETRSYSTEAVFWNFSGAQELIPRNGFRQPL